jgi:hypothetical protein
MPKFHVWSWETDKEVHNNVKQSHEKTWGFELFIIYRKLFLSPLPRDLPSAVFSVFWLFAAGHYLADKW